VGGLAHGVHHILLSGCGVCNITVSSLRFFCLIMEIVVIIVIKNGLIVPLHYPQQVIIPN